jgi:4a-hydroxytetrahydrobiopterin dehydratase
VATLLDETLIADTLESLPGWQGDSARLWREVRLDPQQVTELRRQVEVDAAAMGHAPTYETGEGGLTRVVLCTPSEGGVTELDVMMASHISDLVHRMQHSEPGVEALRDDEVVAVIRPGESATGEDAEEGPELPRKNTAMLES